jgi:hypothetical protein
MVKNMQKTCIEFRSFPLVVENRELKTLSTFSKKWDVHLFFRFDQ